MCIRFKTAAYLRPLLAAALMLAPGAGAHAGSFDDFVQALWPQAQAIGVSRSTFDEAFAGLEVDRKIITLAGRQPEFSQTIQSYVEQRLNAARIARGRSLAATHKTLLDKIEARYGVDRYVVLAIWGLESNYGATPGNSDIIRSLATLACCTDRRPQMFRDELLEALLILQAHDIAPRDMTGSWAGALGQVQFMPSSFRKYAVDMDGDGTRNIWKSVPDALGSIASYLQKHGWKEHKRWAYEVRLPKTFDFTVINTTDGGPASAWAALGVVRADGQPLSGGDRSWMFLPAGAKGPAFLIFENYWTIKTYNISDSYTLSVGLLAERLRGSNGLAAAWPKNQTAPDRARIIAMQQKLRALGYKIDTIDGKIGRSVRAALRSWQASAGLVADGYPSPDVLKRLDAAP